MAASTLVMNPTQAAVAPLTVNPTPVGAYRSHSTELFSAGDEPIRVFITTLEDEASMVPLEVCKFDTIASIKIRMQAQRGFFVDQQRLVYASKELKWDDCLLKYYGVGNGDVLHLVLLVTELISLTVATVNGDSFVYKVCQAEDTEDLHKPLSGKQDTPAVALKGEQLGDSSIKEEFCFKGGFALCLRVHRPKVRSRSVGRKEVELVVMSSDDATLQQWGAPRSDAVARTYTHDFKEVSYPTFQAGAERQFRPELKHSLQQSVKLLLPSKCPFSFDLSDSLKELLELVRMGLQAGQVPTLTAEGSGGVYLMKDECGMRNVGVFKPMDEEPLSVNNPRGYSASNHGEGLKKGTRSGEGAIREVAAYILDHPIRSGTKGDTIKEIAEGFSGVPPTTIVRCYHEAFNYTSDVHKLHEAKKGSLQQFVHAISSCEDMGSSMFPVSEVHKITVLDLRLANTDRNGGNILVCKGKDGDLKLVPIDHGYCLPEKFEDCSFEWLYWPQAQQPYAPSTLAYIDSLDAEADLALLRKCGWSLRPKVARTFRISTMLLKKGAAAGLTPFEIGSIMCRSESLDDKSPIELMLEKVEVRNLKEHAFIKAVAELLDKHIATLKQQQ